MTKPLIRLNNIQKIYQMEEVKVKVLNNINIEILEKEFVAIMGPSGSGKSTLLNMIGCLDRPSSGKVFLNEVDVSALNDAEVAKLREKVSDSFFRPLICIRQ